MEVVILAPDRNQRMGSHQTQGNRHCIRLCHKFVFSRRESPKFSLLHNMRINYFPCVRRKEVVTQSRRFQGITHIYVIAIRAPPQAESELLLGRPFRHLQYTNVVSSWTTETPSTQQLPGRFAGPTSLNVGRIQD